MATSLLARNIAAFWGGEAGRFWVGRYYVFEKHRSPTVSADEAGDFLGFFHLSEHVLTQSAESLAAGDAGLSIGDPQKEGVATMGAVKDMRPIECYLRAPRAVFEAGFTVIAGPYTTYFGLHAVDVAPLAYGKLDFAGVCAHSAIHTALILMSRFGGRPLGLLELTTLYPRIQNHLDKKTDCNEPIGPEMEPEDFTFTIDGLSHKETQLMLCTKESGLWSVSLVLDERELQEGDGEVLSNSANTVLCACIRSGISPIAFIDFPTYQRHVKNEKTGPCPEENTTQQEREGHAVVLVGFRTLSGSRSSIEYLVHDSYLGPWRRILDKDLFKAMEAFVEVQEGEAQAPKICVIPLPIEAKLPPDIAVYQATDFIARLLRVVDGVNAYSKENIRQSMKLRLVARAEAFSLCRSPHFGDSQQQEAQWYLSAWWAKADYLWRATYQNSLISIIVYIATPNSASAPLTGQGVRHPYLAYAVTEHVTDGSWQGKLFLNEPYFRYDRDGVESGSILMRRVEWQV